MEERPRERPRPPACPGVAFELAREAVARARDTACLELRATALSHHATVLAAVGHADDACRAAQQALELYTQKGATVLVARARALLDELEHPAADLRI